MSAGVCGKRVGFEEIFGSSPRRFRCSSCESQPDARSRSDDPVSTFLQMFPAMDPEITTSGLRNAGNKTEYPRENLNAPSSEFSGRSESHSFVSTRIGNSPDILFEEQNVEDVNNIKPKFDTGASVDGPKWVDLFVQEMMSAANIDNAKLRAARILEAFEGSITANKRAAEEIEYTSLKKHLQSLLDNNQILRRAVAIQHERDLEHEGKEREVQHLKLTLSQYTEQVQTLEVTVLLHCKR